MDEDVMVVVEDGAGGFFHKACAERELGAPTAGAYDEAKLEDYADESCEVCGEYFVESEPSEIDLT